MQLESISLIFSRGGACLNSSTWIAIYLPLFVLFFLIIPHQNRIRKLMAVKIKKKRGLIRMASEMIGKYRGKRCKIVTGALGTTVTGEIVEVKENWMEVQTRKGKELINTDFIQSVKIIG